MRADASVGIANLCIIAEPATHAVSIAKTHAHALIHNWVSVNTVKLLLGVCQII